MLLMYIIKIIILINTLLIYNKIIINNIFNI